MQPSVDGSLSGDSKDTRASQSHGRTSVAETSCGERVDLPSLLDQFGGLGELVDQVIETYLEQCPLMLADIDRAVRARDAEALARSAHKFKGAVGVFGVERAVLPAASLELAGQTQQLQHIDELYARLCAEVERLGDELKNLLKH